MTEVMSKSSMRRRPVTVGSFLSGIDSATPPVKSARPSRTVPYLRASYDPCNFAYAFSNRAGQNSADLVDERKTNLLLTVGSLSSTRTSLQLPHHHILNLNIPA